MSCAVLHADPVHGTQGERARSSRVEPHGEAQSGGALSPFFYWNMNYHIEHHMFPSVPFHTLPKFTRPSPRKCRHLMRDSGPHGARSSRSSQSRNAPPNMSSCTIYPQPNVATRLPEASPNMSLNLKERRMNILQWHEVCACDDIDEEDVRAFEHDGTLYAVYHTPTGFYATAGFCTHEAAPPDRWLHVRRDHRMSDAYGPRRYSERQGARRAGMRESRHASGQDRRRQRVHRSVGSNEHAATDRSFV